jgi:hypothetical protein
MRRIAGGGEGRGYVRGKDKPESQKLSWSNLNLIDCEIICETYRSMDRLYNLAHLLRGVICVHFKHRIATRQKVLLVLVSPANRVVMNELIIGYKLG